MKQEFSTPEMEVKNFTLEDVITTSGGGNTGSSGSSGGVINLPIDRF